MRVWDVHPGYLSRTRLLGEHREIHAVWTVVTEDKKGYSNHPETNRWRGHLSHLYRRHEITTAEMRLRGYNHASPLDVPGSMGEAPGFLDPPHEQFEILKEKYDKEEAGRIPLPDRISEFWEHHKYSVLARGHEKHQEIASMSEKNGGMDVNHAPKLVRKTSTILRLIPERAPLFNAWQHVIARFKTKAPEEACNQWLNCLPDKARQLGRVIYRAAGECDETLVIHSTILSDGFRT